MTRSPFSRRLRTGDAFPFGPDRDRALPRWQTPARKGPGRTP